MRPSRPKPLCKFKDTCKNYTQGKQCPFSHQKCKLGNDCKNMETCMFFHQRRSDQSRSNSKFQKQKSQVQCKFGVRCMKKAQGLCGFKHSESSNPNNSSPFKPNNIKSGEQRVPKGETLCRFGQRCTSFPLGKCTYKHQKPFVPSASSNNFHQQEESVIPSRQNHLGLFDNLCLKYLTNNHCDGGCSKAHDFSEAKTIGKIFQVSSCQRVIKRLMVMQPYQTDEQPLYIIFGSNKVAFGQLTNLAKESGNENISNNSLVMKRWFDKDIQFSGDEILSVRLIKAENQHNQRADILICRCSQTIRVVVLNKEKSFNLPINEDIVEAIFIGNVLIILLKSTKTVCFQFDFQRVQFKERPTMVTQPLVLMRKYHKSVQGQELAAGASADGTLCFINSRLQTFVVSFKQIVKDICFTQYQNMPVALILTAQGKIEALSLLTFESSTILEVKLQNPGLVFSSLTLTQQHLFIVIDWFGVLVYNFQKFDKIVGVLGLGDNKWHLSKDQRGNVCLVSQSRQGMMNASIFKVRKF